MKIDKDLIYLFLGKLVQAVVAIFSIKVMTSMLSSSEVGYQYLILSITLWFSWVLINPVGMFVNRHFHEWHKNGHLDRILGKMNGYFLLVAGISIPIVFFVQNRTELSTAYHGGEIVLFACLYIYFSTWFQTGASFFNLLGYQKDFVTVNLVAQISGLGLAWIGICYHSSAIVWLSGLLGGQILGLVAMQLVFRKKIGLERSSTKTPELFSRETLVYCAPLVISTLGMWFLTQGYRIVVENKLGVEVLAALGVGLGLASNFAGVVESVASQYLHPGYYAALVGATADGRRVAWEILWRKTSVIYVSMLCFSVAISHLLVRVITAPAFHHVAYIVIFGSVIELLRQVSNITNLAFHGEKKTQYSVVPYLSAALILCIALIGMIVFAKLNAENILWALIVAGVFGYATSLIIIYKFFRYRMSILLWVQVFMVSLPAALPVLLVDVNTDLFWNFLICSLSGLWVLAAIYYFVKKQERPT